MFKLQSPSKLSPFDAIYLSRHLFPLLKTVFKLIDFDVLSASAIFCFTSSTSAQCFPLRTFFHMGKHKRMLLGVRSGAQAGWGRGSRHFWSKTAEHSVQYGQVCSKITHHEMGKRTERVFQKNSLKPNAASHNNAR